MKILYDQHILHTVFNPFDSVLLYSSRPFIVQKVKSRWIWPFIVKIVYPLGAINIQNPRTSHVLKVNGKYLKHFLEFPMNTRNPTS